VFRGGELTWNLPRLQNCGAPLALTTHEDKLVVAYDSNKLAVFDLLNQCLHQWTTDNLSKLPKNFLNRYNRIVGVLPVGQKFLFFTHYTYFVLDLDQPISNTVQIVNDHPGSQQNQQSQLNSWAESLKLS